MTEKKLDIPGWIRDTDFCIWCKKQMDISSIETKGDDIEVSYACINHECPRLEAEDAGDFTLIYENRAEMYEDFLTKPKDVPAPDTIGEK